MVLNNSTKKRAQLNKIKAEYYQYLKMQDEVMRKKDKANWLKDGYKNTAHFHGIINGRRKRLNIQRIKDDNGVWREGKQDIATTWIEYFRKIFNHN